MLYLAVFLYLCRYAAMWITLDDGIGDIRYELSPWFIHLYCAFWFIMTLLVLVEMVTYKLGRAKK